MNSSPLRIGFVGCGRQASGAWYPNFATLPELDLVACCDIQAELAERNARFYGARRWYNDLTQMLQSEELDAVMVVGPPEMHYGCGKQVLYKMVGAICNRTCPLETSAVANRTYD